MADALTERIMARAAAANEAEAGLEEFADRLADALDIPEITQLVADAVFSTRKQPARKPGGARRG